MQYYFTSSQRERSKTEKFAQKKKDLKETIYFLAILKALNLIEEGNSERRVAGFRGIKEGEIEFNGGGE